ncbi:MAG: hypothetical protein WAN99_06840 [Methanoculleus sp.]
MLHQERSGSTVRCDSLARIKAQDEEFEVRIRALEGWRAEKDNLFIRYRHRRGRLGPQTLRKRWHSTTTSSSSITSPPGEDRAPPGPPPSPVAWRGRHRNQIA